MKTILEVIGALLDWVVNSFRPSWQDMNHQTERLLFVVLLAAVCLLCLYAGRFAVSLTFGA